MWSHLKSTLLEQAYGIREAIESRRWPTRPYSINFEITSICDSKCIHCPRHEMDRPMRPMPMVLFKKLIDQAAEMKVPQLCPNGYGEIMTLRNLEEYLDYISSKRHKFKIAINTNAYRMTEEKIELLIKHKVSFLNICIDGATAPTAESIRVNLKLDQIESNIHKLLEIRKSRGLDYPKLRTGMVVIPQNRHEIQPFLEKWKGKADFVGLDGYSNRGGSLTGKFGENEAIAGAKACVLPFKELTLLADGSAVLCCNDWNAEHKVGDLNTQSLSEIWRGVELTKVRRLQKSGKGAEIKLCGSCNYWKEPTFGTQLFY